MQIDPTYQMPEAWATLSFANGQRFEFAVPKDLLDYCIGFIDVVAVLAAAGIDPENAPR